MVRRRSTRCQSLFLAILLVVTPVALLARPATHGKAKCTGMCCQPRARHTADPSAAAQAVTDSAPQRKKMTCGRGVAVHLAMCMVPSNTEIDYGVVGPFPPAILSAGVPMADPQWCREALPQLSGFSLLGFFPAPFEPPRS
jgi:hypothetical protein